MKRRPPFHSCERKAIYLGGGGIRWAIVKVPPATSERVRERETCIVKKENLPAEIDIPLKWKKARKGYELTSEKICSI